MSRVVIYVVLSYTRFGSWVAFILKPDYEPTMEASTLSVWVDCNQLKASRFLFAVEEEHAVERCYVEIYTEKFNILMRNSIYSRRIMKEPLCLIEYLRDMNTALTKMHQT